jgi:hypothetical protein
MNPGELYLGCEGGAAQLLAEAFSAQFTECKGENYVEMSFASKSHRPGERFLVTMQRREGKTPGELRREAEAARDAAIEQARELREQVAKLQQALGLLEGLHPEPSGHDPETRARQVFEHVLAERRALLDRQSSQAQTIEILMQQRPEAGRA